jgi:hypothetical protein
MPPKPAPNAPANHPGVDGGGGPADLAADARADDDGRPLAQGADHAGDVGGHRVAVVAARRLVAGPVPPHIDRDGAEARVGHLGEHAVPGPPELGKSVQEEHQRARTGLHDVETAAVGADEAVGPRTVQQHAGLVHQGAHGQQPRAIEHKCIPYDGTHHSKRTAYGG